MNEEPTERMLARLTEAHLARLSELARADHEKFFKRQPAFRGRCLAIVLAQGGAQHYVDGKNGVKDLDVWSFFSLPPGVYTFPAPIRNMERSTLHISLSRASAGCGRSEKMRRSHSPSARDNGPTLSVIMTRQDGRVLITDDLSNSPRQGHREGEVASDCSPALRHEPPAVGEVDSDRAQGRWLSNRHKSWRQASTGKAWTLASATPNDIAEKATGHSKRPPETHPRVAARTEVFGMLRFY